MPFCSQRISLACPPWIATRIDNSPLLPPTSCPVAGATMPGMSEVYAVSALPADGIASRTADEMTVCAAVFCTSTTGLCPETVIVSSSEPTLHARR